MDYFFCCQRYCYAEVPNYSASSIMVFIRCTIWLCVWNSHERYSKKLNSFLQNVPKRSCSSFRRDGSLTSPVTVTESGQSHPGWFFINSSAAVRRKVDMLHPLVSANSVKRAFSASVIIKGIDFLRFRFSAFFGAPLLGVLLDSSLVTLFLQSDNIYNILYLYGRLPEYQKKENYFVGDSCSVRTRTEARE